MNIYYQGVNYKAILISGVAAGLATGVLQVGGACCWPIDAIILLASGAFAVHLSGGVSGGQEDTLINGALAGLVAGIIGGLMGAAMYVVIGALSVLLGHTYTAQPGTGIALPVIYGVAGLACCLPTYAFAGLVLGALGAYIYKLANKRSASGSA